MMMNRSVSRSTKTLLLLSILLLLCLISVVNAAEGKCSADAQLYSCPDCGFVQDCLDCEGYRSTDTSNNMCIDRRLFHSNYLWNDLVGMIVWFLMAGVATACGVGGGGIYVPLGILLLQFSPKQASGLSQASIFGASLGGLILNSRDRHPVTRIRSDAGTMQTLTKEGKKKKEYQRILQEPQDEAYEQEYVNSGKKMYTRPLINYDMALFLSPMEMAGAVLGVLVQKILPNWLYLMIAGLVLSFTAYKTYKKFFAVRRKEKKQEAAAEQSASAKQEEEEAEASNNNDEGGNIESAVSVAKGGVAQDDSESQAEIDLEAVCDGAADSSSSTAPETTTSPEQPATTDGEDDKDDNDDDDDNEETALRKQYLEDDMRQYPREKIVALVILWIGLLLLTLFKGGKGVESLVGITCESPWYIVLIVLQFLWMFGFATYFGLKLVKNQKARVAVHYPYLSDDPIWDSNSLRFYGIFTFIAGIVAGLIGIGGGMVLGPLMLIMGLHPRVSSATTATMIVLTSSSVAIIFITSGIVPWSYAVFFFFVCLFGALLGKSKIDAYVKRTGRASLLIFILATIIFFATVGVLVIMFTRLAAQDWCLDGFNAFCVLDSKAACAARMLASFLGMDSSALSPYN